MCNEISFLLFTFFPSHWMKTIYRLEKLDFNEKVPDVQQNILHFTFTLFLFYQMKTRLLSIFL
jgi:hypothetical protein